MEKIISEFTKQFQAGFNIGKKIKIRNNFQGICICGMGGSGLPGSLLLSWLKEIKIPIIIHRDYGLPSSINKNWLILAISYSGNTEETISAVKEAIKKRINCVFISSGGELANIAKKHKIPYAFVPPGIPPRLALGYQFSALVGILSENKLIKCEKKELLNIENKINSKGLKKDAKILAKNLKGKIPLIYSSNRFKAIARIWKIALNENSKIPSFWNYFPELNHNEMVGFTKNKMTDSLLKIFYFLILKSENDSTKNKKRMFLTAELLKKQGINGKIISLKGENILEEMVSSIILANWISYFLSIHYKIDPIPVDLVEEFKRRMRNN